MPFVTKFRLTSGDRVALEGVVTEIKEAAERKGAAMKGPHSRPPEQVSVPLCRRLHESDGDIVGTWEYTVYRRDVEIHGHDDFARTVATRDLPASVRVEATVEHLQGPGN